MGKTLDMLLGGILSLGAFSASEANTRMHKNILYSLERVQEDDKTKVPSIDAQIGAEKEIKSNPTYKRLFSSRSVDVKRELAKKLFEDAQDTENPTIKYVLFKEASDAAAQVIDLDTAFKAVDQLADNYDGIKPAQMRKEIMDTAGKSRLSRLPENRDILSEYYLDLAHYAVKFNEFETAEEAAKSAKKYAARGTLVAYNAEELLDDMKGLEMEGRSTYLALSNDDRTPEANRLVGLCLYFRGYDQKEGLERLTNCSDLTLKSIANLELIRGKDASRHYELGNQWLEASEQKGLHPLYEKRFKKKALERFRQAVRYATGFTKTQYENDKDLHKKISSLERELESELKRIQLDMMRVIRSNHAVKGSWESKGGMLITPTDHRALLQVPYAPGRQYDIDMEVEPTADSVGFYTGLTYNGEQFGIEFDVYNGSSSRLLMIDGKTDGPPESKYSGRALEKDRKNAIHIEVRRNGVTAYVNDDKIIDWKGDMNSLSPWQDWKTSNSSALSIGSNDMNYKIHSYKLTPVSGRGKSAR